MVVVLKVVTAALGDDVEVMMTARPYLAGFYKSAIEWIVGIVHLIHTEHGLETFLVECLVVGNERLTLYHRFYLFPYVGKDGCIICILTAETIDTGTHIIIVVGLGMDKRVELVYFLAITDHYNAD
jgi:hypothetical protein